MISELLSITFDNIVDCCFFIFRIIKYCRNSGKSNFVNPARAKAAAKAVVEKFKAGGCEEMTITGFAAAGVDKPDYLEDKATIDTTNKSLTLARAKKFSTLVRSAGFTGEISTEGFGTCGTEWKPNGKVDTAQQKLCRRVEVSN